MWTMATDKKCICRWNTNRGSLSCRLDLGVVNFESCQISDYFTALSFVLVVEN